MVLDEKLPNFKEATKFGVGASVKVVGEVVVTPGAKQPYEVHAQSVELLGAVAPDYPLQKKRHTLEYLRTISYLRPRTNTFQAVFRIRSAIAYAIHTFFQERGFVYVHTPLITASDCEGAGEMFRVTTIDPENPPRTEDGKVDYSQDFFGRQTNLTVSGQMEAEAMAMAFGNVYTFGPTFRAEHVLHHPPCCRILDDRAGDGFCRPAGRYGMYPRYAEVRHRVCAGTLPG